MEESQQEQIGKAISELKQIFPDKSVCERADLVFGNQYLLGAVMNTNGNGNK